MSIDTTDILMPPLPRFLDRSRWTQEEREARNKSWEVIARRRAAKAHALRDKAERVRRAEQLEKQERDARKAKRKLDRENRKARKREKQADREKVVRLIDQGQITIGQMRKASSMPTPRLKRAIRWLLTNGHIRKASARTYAA